VRLLAGALAEHNVVATLAGDQSLLARPMKRIIDPLNQMGAQVVGTEDKPPLRVSGRSPLSAISYEMSVASAQAKSAILFAGLKAHGRTEIIEPHATRDHTERLLGWFGVDIKTIPIRRTNKTRTTIEGPHIIEPRDVVVPGDISSAAFLIAAAALLPGSKLQIRNIGLNPTRTGFLTVLQSFGAHIEVRNVQDVWYEPVGDTYVEGT